MSNVIASVRLHGEGFDVELRDDGKIATRHIIPNGSSSGVHDEVEALALLASIGKLAKF